MTDTIISLRVNRSLKERMKIHDHINWSAILRRALSEQLRKEERFDYNKARKASKNIDKLRKSKVFSKGEKMGVEIIREWRNKKKL